MTTIISITHNNLYLFYLPIVTWAWNKLGCDVVVVGPDMDGEVTDERIELILDTQWGQDLQMHWVGFNAPPDKEATYAQCSRLYATAFKRLLPDDEIIITSDVDMALFNIDYFAAAGNGCVHVYGSDLVPEGQYPICYIAMTAATWREVMEIKPGESMQNKLDQLLGDIECENFRGNYWSLDQETAYNQLAKADKCIIKHPRALPGTQFATRRADRDGWPTVIPPDIIDAHLPRPGYTEGNFNKIMNLFVTMYPNDDLQWMVDYRNEYIKLL